MKAKKLIIITSIILSIIMLSRIINYEYDCNIEGHSYYIWNTIVTPTCTENGYKTRKCIHCGAEELEILPATGHTESDWSILHEPTCTIDGAKQKVCLTCGCILAYESIPATKHVYNSDMICQKCGFDCSICYGNHQHVSDLIIDVEPTCCFSGSGHFECLDCGAWMMSGVINPTSHSASDWTIIKEPTCAAAGERIISCLACGLILSHESLPKKAHIASSWIIDTLATCNSKGCKHTECTVCHTVLNSAEIPELEHTIKIIPLKEPTHTLDGEGIEYCIVCQSYLEGVAIKAEGHTYKNYVCTVCGDNIWDSSWTAGLVFRDGQLYSLGNYKNPKKGTLTIVVPAYTPEGLAVATVDANSKGKVHGHNYSRIILVLPDTITNMAVGCFEGCTFKEIQFGTSVGGFSNRAFKNGRFNIRYNGTLAQWNQIRVANWVWVGYTGYIYCTDATIYYKNGELKSTTRK